MKYLVLSLEALINTGAVIVSENLWFGVHTLAQTVQCLRSLALQLGNISLWIFVDSVRKAVCSNHLLPSE